MTRSLLCLIFAIAPIVSAQTPDPEMHVTKTPGPEKPTVPQRDLIDLLHKVLGKQPDSAAPGPEESDKVTVAVLPSFSSSPTTGLLLGVSANAVGPSTPLAPPATVNASASYTTKKQFKLVLRGNLFSKDGSTAWQLDWRYHNNNQPTYGLGSIQPNSARHDMDFKQVRLSQWYDRRLSGRLYMGVGYHLESFFSIVDLDTVPGELTPFQRYEGVGTTSTLSSGLSAQLVFEGRDSPIYPTRGQGARAAVFVNPTWLGSDDNWQSVVLEGRLYPRITKRSLLALWGRWWLTLGHAPYFQLPAVGWDIAGRTGRGYVQGRIRAQDMSYLEAEYRIQLSADGFWGAAAFLNAISASDPLTGALQQPNFGGGVGLRVKLNKHSNTNITIDLGFSEGSSPSVFLGTGEAF